MRLSGEALALTLIRSSVSRRDRLASHALYPSGVSRQSPDEDHVGSLVGHAVADLKLRRQDGGLCGFTLLLLGAWL